MNSVKSDDLKFELIVDGNDINTSLSLPKSDTTISLDLVLKKCGDLGRFQLIHYFFINLVAMSSAVIGFYYVFAAAEPDHRCRLPPNVWPYDTEYNPINETYKSLIDSFIPKTKDGKTWEKCLRYQIANRTDTLIDCPNQWVYNRSIFGYTFTEEGNFVCKKETGKSWLATLMQCGGFALIFIGSLADKYGRKKITVIVTIILLIICFITQIIIQWVPMPVEAKFALLLVNQFASGLTATTFSIIFILMLELTSSAHTSFAGNAALIAFTIGEAIVTLFAYLAKDWQILKWADTIFIALVIPYLYFMPESPLYIYSKREFVRLEKLLRQMANINKRNESDWFPYYQELLRSQSTVVINHHDLKFTEKFKRILKHRPTIIKLLVSGLLGFTTLMLYIKISYGLAVMDISPYLGILIGAVVEAIGYITGSLLISTKFARKGSFILMLTLTIICVILIPIVIKYNSIATVFIAQFGKFTISGSIAVSWIFVPELFPTSIRSGANGFFIGCSRIGAIVAPIINTSVSNQYLPYTFYVSAGLAVVVVLLTLILPETKDKPMDDVQDYATN